MTALDQGELVVVICQKRNAQERPDEDDSYLGSRIANVLEHLGHLREAHCNGSFKGTLWFWTAGIMNEGLLNCQIIDCNFVGSDLADFNPMSLPLPIQSLACVVSTNHGGSLVVSSRLTPSSLSRLTSGIFRCIKEPSLLINISPPGELIQNMRPKRIVRGRMILHLGKLGLQHRQAFVLAILRVRTFIVHTKLTLTHTLSFAIPSLPRQAWFP